MELSDRLGTDGAWFHVSSEHHQVALVNKGYAHLHHLAFDMVDWSGLGVAFDHLGQHGRWLGWGPVRHGIAQNICGYVRITEEPMLRGALLRHGAARARPRRRATGRTTGTRPTPGARCPRARTSDSMQRPCATSARASRCWARSSPPLEVTRTDGDDQARSGRPHRPGVPGRPARRCPRDLAERREDHPPARPPRAGGGRALARARLRPAARARRRDARAVARRRPARERHPPDPALAGGSRAPPARDRADRRGHRRDDGPHARLPERHLRVLRGPRRRVGAARQRAGRREPRRLPDARCATATSRPRTRS